MKKLTKFYTLSISLGLILLIFDFFNKYQSLIIIGTMVNALICSHCSK